MNPDCGPAIGPSAVEYLKAGCDYLQVSTGIEWEDPSVKEDEGHFNIFCSLGVRFHDHFKGRIPISCVNSINTPEQVRYLIENELVDTVDLGRAVLADPAFCEAVLDNVQYKKYFDCPRCQYGPGMPHKCPAKNR